MICEGVDRKLDVNTEEKFVTNFKAVITSIKK